MVFIDLAFRITGSKVLVDHGYLLLAAISEIIPDIHNNRNFAVHPINGELMGGRLLTLTDNSFLKIRLPVENIPIFLPLAGKVLKIGEDRITVGVPISSALKPFPKLYCRLAIIKGFMEHAPFLEAAMRQAEELGIKGKLDLVEQTNIAGKNKDKSTGTKSPFLRRTIKVRDKNIVGFALRASELTAEESLTLQEKGIGGRRRFGCGIFIPDRR